MKFLLCVNMHVVNMWYKFGLNHGIDNKVMNLYLTVCQRVWSTSQIILLYFQRGVVKCLVYTLFIQP